MKAVIVVDVQNDFVYGTLGSEEAANKIPMICETIEQLADEDTFFYCTLDTHNENYSNTQEGTKLPVSHCVAGSWGHAVVDDVISTLAENAYYSDYIHKPTFGSLDLLNTMWADEIEFDSPFESITLMGFCTDICVVANALLLKTAFPEVEINVVEDCCGGTSYEAHKAAIEVMKSCQINII